MNTLKTFTAVVLTSLSLAATAAPAADQTAAATQAPHQHSWSKHKDGAPHMTHRHGKRAFQHGASLDRAILHNAVIDELIARTGRSADDIRAAFKQGSRGEGLKQLGIEPAAMREVFENARKASIARAQAAGLISAEQATQLNTPRAQQPRRPRKAEKAD
ncbi:hypothetical protein [Sinimarinibacterium sp. NLF-5-8]|uniref:hypothetical protein n=1 Tax=Sinimarinibacterium sp. NLF-5-8 TaxID=2698684 RepID=UPI00137BA9F3|nr:hypothetical protein [Sinimarinibacterium sp. NLF-5-8]QHS10246.1 hypothetical protein GT972_08895 [Sinimarinibacterium sp. NLF-5-8]